jgi:hypothetical protein
LENSEIEDRLVVFVGGWVPMRTYAGIVIGEGVGLGGGSLSNGEDQCEEGEGQRWATFHELVLNIKSSG